MARTYDKKVKPHLFEKRDKILKGILPIQDETKEKFFPNWQGSFIVKNVLPGEVLILIEIDGQVFLNQLIQIYAKSFSFDYVNFLFELA